MDDIMKNKECMNCGSTKFHQIETGWKCDYCGTLYLNPERARSEKQSTFLIKIKNKKFKTIVTIVIFIFPLFVGLIHFKMAISQYKPVSRPTVPSKTNKNYPGNWTEGIYNGVVVATERYDANKEKYSFENGSNYKELEALVGKPDTVTTWEKENYGMPSRCAATWNKSRDGDSISNIVTVTYDKHTLMIMDKSHY